MGETFIGFDVQGLPQVQAALRRWPKNAVDAGADEMSEYLISALKHYPPKKNVTRKTAYGKSFFSARQRRWFFANLESGLLRIPYRRTQGLAKGWKRIGEGESQIIVNERPGVEYVMGDGTQSRHESLVGWKTLQVVVDEHRDGMMKKFIGAVKKVLKKSGLKYFG